MDTFIVSVYLRDEDVRKGEPSAAWAIFRARDGYFLKVIDKDSSGTTERLSEAGYDPNRAAEIPFSVDRFRWDDMHDHRSWAATSEKFSNYLAEELWEASLDSSQDAELGESESFGWFALFAEECAILHTDSRGFVSVSVLDSEEAARNSWAKLEEDYEMWCEQNDEE